MEKKTKITDIFEGDYLQFWGDSEGWLFINLIPHGVSISIHPDLQEGFFEELLEISSDAVKHLKG